MASPRIFISYRREDASGHAGRLYDALASHFGRDNVFIDVDTIRPGSDFAEAIDRAVTQCDVLVALIGRQWLTTELPDGRRRLEDPDDFVRIELESALAHDLRVIPTAVQGTAVPDSRELPASLAPLARRQGIELRDTAWHDDVQRLIRRLEQPNESSTRIVARAHRRPRRRVRLLVAGGVVAVLTAIAVVVTVLASGGGPTDSGRGSTGASHGKSQLLAAIPAVMRPACHSISWGEKSAEASVECDTAQVSAVYNLFAAPNTMSGWYQLQRETAGINPGSGACTATSFHGEASYKDGRYFCMLDSHDQPTIAWTDVNARIGAAANTFQGKGAAAAASLLREWQCCFKPEH